MCGTLDMHQTNMLVTCARFINTHVQYIGIGNAAGSHHNTTNPTVQRHPTALLDN